MTIPEVRRIRVFRIASRPDNRTLIPLDNSCPKFCPYFDGIAVALNIVKAILVIEVEQTRVVGKAFWFLLGYNQRTDE